MQSVEQMSEGPLWMVVQIGHCTNLVRGLSDGAPLSALSSKSV